MKFLPYVASFVDGTVQNKDVWLAVAGRAPWQYSSNIGRSPMWCFLKPAVMLFVPHSSSSCVVKGESWGSQSIWLLWLASIQQWGNGNLLSLVLDSSYCPDFQKCDGIGWLFWFYTHLYSEYAMRESEQPVWLFARVFRHLSRNKDFSLVSHLTR